MYPNLVSNSTCYFFSFVTDCSVFRMLFCHAVQCTPFVQMISVRTLLNTLHARKFENFLEKIAHFGALLSCLIFTIAAVTVSLTRFWQFETQYYDFGIFDVAIREVAKFQPPIIDHFIVEDKWIFADHFHPAIFLLSPLYWFTNRSEVLLIAQAVAVGLSGVVLYRCAQLLLKKNTLSLAVVLSYFLFVGLQNALITDFHEITVMTLPLMLCYFAVISGRKKLFVAMFVLTLAFKELLFPLGLGLAFFVYRYRPEWKKLAISTATYALLWGVITIKFVIPAFAGGSYQYAPTSHSFTEFLSQFFTPIIKLKTTFNVLWSFLFLPLLSLPTLPILVMNFAMRFLSGSTNHWDLGFHYNAEIAPTLAISAAFGLAALQKKYSPKVVLFVAGLLILNSAFLYRVMFRGPLALSYNPAFYAHTKDFKYLNDFLAKVPLQKNVMTQNNLAVRFTDRKVKLLRDGYETYQPELVVLDLREGQNLNNFMGVKDVKNVLARLLVDPNYRVIYQQADQYIFEKK